MPGRREEMGEWSDRAGLRVSDIPREKVEERKMNVPGIKLLKCSKLPSEIKH